MALRNQPYIPLYVKDFTSDEKLRMCSPAAVGVYIFLLCILHREKEYGKLRLCRSFVYTKPDTNGIQNPYKTRDNKENLYKQFAENLAKQMPFKVEDIQVALLELDYYGVIKLEGDTLIQQRMAKDGEVSEKRSKSISKRWGAKNKADETESFVYTKDDTNTDTNVNTNTDTKPHTKANTKRDTKPIQNTECARVGTQNSVHIYNQDNNNLDREKEESLESVVRGAGERSENKKAKRAQFTPPTYEEVAEYCRERGNGIDAQLFVDHYAANGWVQGKAGKPLKDWKAAVRTWERNGIVRTGGNNGTATGETRQQAEAAANHRRVDAGEGQPKQRRSTL